MKAMKVLALNYITFVVVVMSMAGVYLCSTDYMAYDVELKDGIYFASDSLTINSECKRERILLMI